MQTLPETFSDAVVLAYWTTCLQMMVLPRQQLITELTRGYSANENARDTLIVFQLTQIWINMTYVGETETSV